MSLYIPSFAEALNVARGHGRDSEAPRSWNGIRALWTMLEGGGLTVYDLGGYGKNSTLTLMDPATDWVAGALDFDGGDDYLNVAGSESGVLAFTTGDFSFAVWAKPTSALREVLIGKRSGGDNGYRLYKRATADDGLELQMDDGGQSNFYSNAVVIDDSAWHHLAASVDRSANVDFYVDGKPAGSADVTGRSGDISAATPLQIGRNPAGTQEFTGQMSMVAIYSRALAPAEIQQLYEKPNAMLTLRRKVYAAAAAPAGSPWYYSVQEQVAV